MKKKILIIPIILLALILKLHNYSIYPQRGATSDEYTYSFLGLSLLTKGIPISWSHFGDYKNITPLTIDKIYFPLVQPYFDHPPLNGLFVAAWALLVGEDTFEKISLSTIRLVPIFFSLISAILVYLIAKKIYDEQVGLWSLLIYTTATTFVINGRVVLAENLLTVWLLFSIYLLSNWKKINNFSQVFLLGFIAGLAFWTKELGVTVFFTTLFFLIKNKNKPLLLIIYILTFSFFFLGYIAYGYFYDAEIFWKIITIQGTRQLGPQTFDMLFHHQYIVNKPYFDGWYYFGFIAIFISFWDVIKNKYLSIPALIYFCLMLFSLTREGEMGWYMIPLFPFMAILSAALISEATRSSINNWFILTPYIFVGLAQIRTLFEANFGLTSFQFRIMLITMFVPFVICYLLNNSKWFIRFGKVGFYLLILGNIIQTYTYVHPA